MLENFRFLEFTRTPNLIPVHLENVVATEGSDENANEIISLIKCTQVFPRYSVVKTEDHLNGENFIIIRGTQVVR